MTGIELIDWVIGGIVALAGAFGVIAGGMKMIAEGRNLRAKPVTPYDAVVDRLVKLERADEYRAKEVSRLRSQLYRLAGVLTREVATIISWYEGGLLPPPPDREIEIIKEIIGEIQDDRRESKE